MMNDIKFLDFKSFVYKETKEYLGDELGRILNSIQSLADDAKKIGADKLIEYSKRLVSDIRAVVGGHWLPEDIKYLQVLQKIGVELAKALQEKGDLETKLISATQALQSTVKEMGVPINDLGVSPKNQPSKQGTQPSNTLGPTEPTVAPELPQGNPVPPEGPVAPLGQPPLT